MNRLADLQYILRKWCIQDWYFPNSRDKRTPEQGRNNIDDSDVEHEDTSWICRQKWWKHFLTKDEETETWSEEDSFLHVYSKVLSCIEGLFHSPIVVEAVGKAALVSQVKTSHKG